MAAVLGSGAARDLAFKCAAAFAASRGEASDANSLSYWASWTPVGAVAALVFRNGHAVADTDALSLSSFGSSSALSSGSLLGLSSGSSSGSSGSSLGGRFFVQGLPTDARTGLPFHVCAQFHLGPARRLDTFDTNALGGGGNGILANITAASAPPLPSGRLLTFDFATASPFSSASDQPAALGGSSSASSAAASASASSSSASASSAAALYAVSSEHRATAEWNHELLHSCVGDAVVDMLAFARDLFTEPLRPLLYRHWPLRSQARVPFAHALPALAHRLAADAVAPLFLTSELQVWCLTIRVW